PASRWRSEPPWPGWSTRTTRWVASRASPNGPKHSPVCANPCTSATVGAAGSPATRWASVEGVADAPGGFRSDGIRGHRRLRAPMDTEPSPPDVAATYAATLVDEWVALGLTDLAVSPGARSTPMALAFAEDDRVRVHVHHDERSASFMALGLAAATGRPAAVLC